MMREEEIVGKIKMMKEPNDWILITGGEPLFQDIETLSWKLVDTFGYNLAIETNGTYHTDYLCAYDFISVDLKTPSSRTKVDFETLQEIIDEVYALMQGKLMGNRVKFVSEYAEDLPLIFVDAQQIQQVLLNLMLNANDAMANGGALRLSARQVKAKLLAVKGRKTVFEGDELDSVYVEIKISDTGEGISTDKLRTIFDPFFTTKTQGTGLGLSIVQRIIDEHEGEIRVVSSSGEGTTFTIFLPTEE